MNQNDTKTTQEIIKNFLVKMANQDNRGTAFPYFYVIRTEVEVAAHEGNGKSRWYDNENCQTYDTIEEFRESLAGEPGEYIDKRIEELSEFWVENKWEDRGMFLTETDAEEHLKANHYHYSHNAHTYVKHAFRAPEMEEFFKALFDHFEVMRKSI